MVPLSCVSLPAATMVFLVNRATRQALEELAAAGHGVVRMVTKLGTVEAVLFTTARLDVA